MNPLKIEVTEAIERAVVYAVAETKDIKAGITAAFQHPEFVRQIREQVMACVPERSTYFENADINQARASLGRLLGEEA